MKHSQSRADAELPRDERVAAFMLGLFLFGAGGLLIRYYGWVEVVPPASVELDVTQDAPGRTDGHVDVIGIGGGGSGSQTELRLWPFAVGLPLVVFGLASLGIAFGRVPDSPAARRARAPWRRPGRSEAPVRDEEGAAGRERAASDVPAARSGGSKDAIGYDCPHCGAAVAADARISPRGDVVCSHCDGWISLRGAPPAGPTEGPGDAIGE